MEVNSNRYWQLWSLQKKEWEDIVQPETSTLYIIIEALHLIVKLLFHHLIILSVFYQFLFYFLTNIKYKEWFKILTLQIQSFTFRNYLVTNFTNPTISNFSNPFILFYITIPPSFFFLLFLLPIISYLTITLPPTLPLPFWVCRVRLDNHRRARA